MAGRGKTHKRKLIVTGQKPIAPIGTKSGGQSTLYEVYATDSRGELVEAPLRAFTELEEGVLIEYTIERYTSPKYGTSFTLTPPPRNTAKRVRQLEDEIEVLQFWAEEQGFDAKKSKRTMEEKRAIPAEARDCPDLDEKFGEEAPWTDEDLEKPPDLSGESDEAKTDEAKVKDMELG